LDGSVIDIQTVTGGVHVREGVTELETVVVIAEGLCRRYPEGTTVEVLTSPEPIVVGALDALKVLAHA
jgi:hypothetical protein